MSNSPFSTEDKIKLMEAFCTFPICGLLGFIAAKVGLALSWPVWGLLALSLTLTMIFLLTPLAGLLRGWVRRKAESYYYGT